MSNDATDLRVSATTEQSIPQKAMKGVGLQTTEIQGVSMINQISKVQKSENDGVSGVKQIAEDQKSVDTFTNSTGYSSVSVDQVMDRIRQFINKTGVMVEDIFHEYDPLRQGYVNCYDFKKAINQIFQDILTSEEIDDIKNQYLFVGAQDRCDWPKFLHDAESTVCLSETDDISLDDKRSSVIREVIRLTKNKINFTKLLYEADSLALERNDEHDFDRQKKRLLHLLGDTIGGHLMKTVKEMYTGHEGFKYHEFLQDIATELGSARHRTNDGQLKSTPVFCLDIPDQRKQSFNTKRPQKRERQTTVISYEMLVWITYIVVTILCIVDHFVREGDVVLNRSGKHPSRIWGTNIGETITNVVWAVTARLIITSQNLMFYTMLWCIPNILTEIAPKWINIRGIRDVHAKMHTFAGIFLIAIPSLAHVLVIFLPPLVDGTKLTYRPNDHLNWSKIWDPAAVEGWTFNDHTGVHLTSDEVYRFVLMIVLFIFFFPLSRSHYVNQRSYSLAMTLHAFAGIWYAIDNIRKITHGLAHFVNLPVLILWCFDRALSIWAYRCHSGKIVRKDIVGNNEYAIVYMKLDNNVKHAVGDVYYLLHRMERKTLLPQRSHPFTTFANLSQDSNWDIGFVISIIEDQKQLCVPWTNWLTVESNTCELQTWGPYRSSVWNLGKELLDKQTTNSHYILFASGSGCGYLLDVLSTIAYTEQSFSQGKYSNKTTVDIFYSVRCIDFYNYLQGPINKLMHMINEKDSFVVNFHFYVTSPNDFDNYESAAENYIRLNKGRIDFEKVLKSAKSRSRCYFIGRPEIAKNIKKICNQRGIHLVKDYTNGRSKENDRALLMKYLRRSFWAILFIVGILLLSSVVIDIRDIKNSLQTNDYNTTQ